MQFGGFLTLSIDLGAQCAPGCCSGWAKPVHGGSCLSLSQSSAAVVSTGLVWVGRTWATGLWLRRAWVQCWLSQCVHGSLWGLGASPQATALFCLSAELWRQKSLQDSTMFNVYSINELKNHFTKKLSIFLPIIDIDKLALKLLPFSLCSNLGKFSNSCVCCLLTLGHWSNTSTGSEKQKYVPNLCNFKPMALTCRLGH